MNLGPVTYMIERAIEQVLRSCGKELLFRLRTMASSMFSQGSLFKRQKGKYHVVTRHKAKEAVMMYISMQLNSYSNYHANTLRPSLHPHIQVESIQSISSTTTG
jgi:hypothetical protein